MSNPICPICGQPMEFMFVDVNDGDVLVDVYECEDCETAKEMVAEDYLPTEFDDDEDYDYGLGYED